MILLITSIARAQECARVLQEATHEPVTVCAVLQEAVLELKEKEFSAVVFDLLLLDAQPDESETALKNLGSAVPVYLNFAITGIPRVVWELRWAVQRRKREMLTAKSQAEQALRHELCDTVTALAFLRNGTASSRTAAVCTNQNAGSGGVGQGSERQAGNELDRLTHRLADFFWHLAQ